MGQPLTVAHTHTIAAPSDAVWNVIGDFGTEHRWSRAVGTCTRDTPDVRVGTTRICKLPKPVMGRTEARETLTEFEHGRVLAYTLDGPAGPFASAGSRWVTAAKGGATVITVEGRFEPRNAWVRALVWPLAKLYVRRIMRTALRELDSFITAPKPT